MYKVAICDDDPDVLKRLSIMIQKYIAEHDLAMVYRTYLNPKMLIADMEEDGHYDIIYIDVEMPQLNGIDAIRKIKKLQPFCLIIILSSYTEYGVEAVNLEVFRYLVKGKTEDLFYLSLDAALKRVEVDDEDCYCIVTPRKHIKIALRDILYCYKNAKMCVLVTEKGHYCERKTLQQLLIDLNKLQESFVMIERGFIVNIRYINRIDKKELVLDNQQRLPIGSTYLNHVKQQLDSYWRKRL